MATGGGNTVVNTAIYQMSYTVEGQPAVDSMKASVTALVGQTEKQEVAQEKANRAARTATGEYSKMMARLDQRVAAENRLARALDQISRMQSEGTANEQRRAAAVTAAMAKYDQAIAQIESRQEKRISPRTDQQVLKEVQAEFAKIQAMAEQRGAEAGSRFAEELNQRIIAGTGKSARESATVMRDALDEIDRFNAQQQGKPGLFPRGDPKVLEEIRAEFAKVVDIAEQSGREAGQRFSAELNSQLIAGPAKSAKDSAAVFAEAGRAQDQLAASAARLKAQLNPIQNAYDLLQEELAQYQAMAAKSMITTDQLAQATDRAKAATERQVQTMRQGGYSESFLGAADATKLSAFQLQNLTFQLQDVGQAIATNQPLGRTLIQQGSQMVQVFGPGVGLGGALKAVGSGIVTYLTNPLNAAVVVFALVAAGAQSLFKSLGGGTAVIDAAAAANDNLASSVDIIAEQYNAATGEVERFGQAVTESEVRRLTTELTEAQEAFRGLLEQSRLTSQVNQSLLFGGVSEADLRTLIGFMVEFTASVEAGAPAVATLQQNLAIFANGASEHVAGIADNLAALTRQVFEGADGAEVSIQGLAENIAALFVQLETLTSGVGGGGGGDGGLDSFGQSFEVAVDSLREMVPELAEAVEQTEQLREAQDAYAAAVAQVRASFALREPGGMFDDVLNEIAANDIADLDKLLAQVINEIDGTGEAFREAMDDAQGFVDVSTAPELEGLAGTIMDIRRAAEEAAAPLLDLWDSGKATPEQLADIDKMLVKIGDAENAQVAAARAADAHEKELERLEDRAESFNDAMAELADLAAGPGLTPLAEAGEQLGIALDKAANRMEQMLANARYIAAVGALFREAGATVNDFLGDLQAQIDALSMSELDQQVAENVAAITDALAEMGIALPPGVADRVRELVTELVTLTDAKAEFAAGMDEIVNAAQEFIDTPIDQPLDGLDGELAAITAETARLTQGIAELLLSGKLGDDFEAIRDLYPAVVAAGEAQKQAAIDAAAYAEAVAEAERRSEAYAAALGQLAEMGRGAVTPIQELEQALAAASANGTGAIDAMVARVLAMAAFGQIFEDSRGAVSDFVAGLQSDLAALSTSEVDLQVQEALQQIAEELEAIGGSLSESEAAVIEDLVRTIFDATEEADNFSSAFDAATSAAQSFIDTDLPSNLEGLAGEIADIAQEADGLVDALEDLLDMPGLDKEARRAIGALVGQIRDAETAQIDAAKAADRNAQAIENAEIRAENFADAIQELRNIGAPTMNGIQNAVTAMTTAFINANSQLSQMVGLIMAAMAIGGVIQAANEQVDAVVEGLERENEILAISNDVEQQVQRAIDAAAAGHRALGLELLPEQVADIRAAVEANQALIEVNADRRRAENAAERDADKETEFEKAVEGIEEQIAAIELEIEMFGEEEEAIEAVRIQRELLAAAMETGGSVTEAEQARVDELVASYLDAAMQLKELEKQQEKSEDRAETMQDLFGDALEAVLDFADGSADGMDLLIRAADKAQNFFAEQAKKAMASGNWGMTAVFAVAAIISAIVKRRLEEKKKLEEAKKAWEEMRDELDAFAKELAGIPQGDLASALAGAREKMQKFADAAIKAGKPIDDLSDMLTQFARRLVRDFVNVFPLMLHALESGLGPDSPAVQGAMQMAEVGKSLLGYLGDLQTVIDLTKGENGSGTATTGNIAGETIRKATDALDETNEVMERTRKASISYALSLLGIPPALSEVETAVLTLVGKAQGLKGVLADLGLSADEAEAAIAEGLAAALDELANNFAMDVQERLNQARGKGYINDVRGLIDDIESMLQDAALLGLGQIELMEILKLEAQAIVDAAGLTGDAFDELIEMFPELAGVIHEAVDAVDAEMDRLNGVARTIVDYLSGLRAGGESTLSPQERLASARALYESQLALAQTGDLDAQASITKYAEDFRAAARLMFASSTQYQDVLSQIQNDLIALPAVQDSDDPVVVELRKTLSELIDVNQHLIDIENAVRRGPADFAAFVEPMFSDLDTNLDGLLTADELVSGLDISLEDAERLLGLIDINGDGAISKLELQLAKMDVNTQTIAAAILAGPAAIAELLAPAFDILDTNTDGLLNFEELKTGLNLSMEETEALLKALDLNGDNMLSKFEIEFGASGHTKMDLIRAITEGGPAQVWRLLSPHFDDIDTNTDGLLTFDELKTALGLPDAQIQALIDAVDFNKDGVIGKLESVLGSKGLTVVKLEAALAELKTNPGKIAGLLLPVFSDLDLDKNLKLNSQELKLALGITATQANTMIKALDVNGDNQLSELELLNATTNKLGESTEQIWDYLATDFFSPMVESLINIEVSTAKMAQNTQRQGFFARLFPRLFGQDGGGIPRMATGGLVNNGVWNVDSVMAEYLGGGNIGLAGGEYVVKASAVNAQTLGALDYMNENGRMPANDNNAEHFYRLYQLMDALHGDLVAVLKSEMQMLRREVGDVTRAVRGQPATTKKQPAKVG